MADKDKNTSFSARVKSELMEKNAEKKTMQSAELYAMLLFGAKRGVRKGDGEYLKFSSDNIEITKKTFTMIKKGFNIGIGAYLRAQGARKDVLRSGIVVKNILKELEKECFKDKSAGRAFLRGAFICAGSMSNPENGYHLEFVCSDEKQRDLLLGVSNGYSLKPRTVIRKKNHIVYFKEGEAISDLLNIMGAHRSLMELENTRILKEMRGNVNRRVNCETANIAKTVNAASRQLEDIAFLKEKGILETLPERLQEIALLRLEYPEATLTELSGMCSEPVGRSGINHRLRKLSEEASEHRQNGGT